MIFNIVLVFDTRTQNTLVEPVRALKVLAAVERFVAVSDEVGCMPDDWPRWRNALEDAWDDFQRTTLDEFGDDVFDHSGDASPVRRFQRAAVRFP
jgi:hypothetical protein